MDLNRNNIRKIRGLIVFTALVLLAVIYIRDLAAVLSFALGIVSPFLIGAAMAFVLNIPLCAIEKHLFGKAGKRLVRVKRPVSIVLTLISVVFLFTLLIVTVVPQLGKTFVTLGNQIPVFFNRTMRELENLFASNPRLLQGIEEWDLAQMDWNQLLNGVMEFLKSGVSSMVVSTFGVASSIVSGVVNSFIALVFAIYILAQKEKLGSQSKRLFQAYLPEKVNRQVIRVCGLLYANFSRFITGQCLEAVILGTMFFVAMTLFRFPYALLIGVLIAFTALIPIVGAFIGCFVGAFLILVDDPIKAVWFVVLFLVLQQIEGNLIYPHVVGGSVGLPSIWVLAAVTVGGSLFGILGMLVLIPLVSTVYGLVREDVNGKLQKQKGKEKENDPGRQSLKKK